ncbi:hypothetical protein K0M31_016573, partial [Melipona bicolor]
LETLSSKSSLPRDFLEKKATILPVQNIAECRGHSPDCIYKHSHDVDPVYSIGRAMR